MHADPVSPCNSKEVVVCLCSSPCSEKWLWKNHTCTLTPFLLRFCHLQQLAGVCYCVLGLWNETLVVPFEISSSGRWKIDKSMHMVNGKTKAGRFVFLWSQSWLVESSMEQVLVELQVGDECFRAVDCHAVRDGLSRPAAFGTPWQDDRTARW